MCKEVVRTIVNVFGTLNCLINSIFFGISFAFVAVTGYACIISSINR